MKRILVTPRSLTATPHPMIEKLKQDGFDIVYSTPGQLPGEAELMRLVPGISGWIAGVEPISEAVIACADKLRVISRNGIGIDNLPIPYLEGRQIAVRVAAGSNARGDAELALGMMFAALRHIPLCDAGIKAGQWPRRIGREIQSRCVGIIGYGPIGREVARLCVELGANVFVYDPFADLTTQGDARIAQVDLATLLEKSELISLHCPPKPDVPLIGKPELAAMRVGTVLINTARASLIDESAILDALNSGKVSVYATDVFESEPPQTLDLVAHPNVIATSHIGGFTDESVARATDMAVHNMIECLDRE